MRAGRPGTLEGAAAVIGRLADQLADGEEETISVLSLPDWEADYLWQVLTVFRRAQAGEPAAAALRELLTDLGYGLDCRLEQSTRTCSASWTC